MTYGVSQGDVHIDVDEEYIEQTDTQAPRRSENSDNVKKKVKKLIKKKVIYISYWDLGGDELYFATHHIHFTPDAVYLLVFNIAEMEKEKPKILG